MSALPVNLLVDDLWLAQLLPPNLDIFSAVWGIIPIIPNLKRSLTRRTSLDHRNPLAELQPNGPNLLISQSMAYCHKHTT
jgi:hypothetical protein